MRYALLVSYDGTEFGGWQIQDNARTVQAEIESAASGLFGVPVKVRGSGRTDAGVHAWGQVCHFDAETSIPAERIAICLNQRLPSDVRIRKSAACEGFDCTKGKEKLYCYSFYAAPTEIPILERYAVRVRRTPDLNAMNAAAKELEGEHDFKAFCASGSSAKTSVRRIFEAHVEVQTFFEGTMYRFYVSGAGFLYNMVRIMAGELYEVGCGKPSAIQTAFKTGQRSCLGDTMSAKGLTLMDVRYENSPFQTK